MIDLGAAPISFVAQIFLVFVFPSYSEFVRFAMLNLCMIYRLPVIK